MTSAVFLTMQGWTNKISRARALDSQSTSHVTSYFKRDMNIRGPPCNLWNPPEINLQQEKLEERGLINYALWSNLTRNVCSTRLTNISWLQVLTWWTGLEGNTPYSLVASELLAPYFGQIDTVYALPGPYYQGKSKISDEEARVSQNSRKRFETEKLFYLH